MYRFWLISIEGVCSVRSWKQNWSSGLRLNSFHGSLTNNSSVWTLTSGQMQHRRVPFLTPETQGRWITVKRKVYITAVNQMRKNTEQRIRWPWFPLECRQTSIQMCSVLPPTCSAVAGLPAARLRTRPGAQLCLAPCCENSVLWTALLLSDTCALADSYLLPTASYHSSGSTARREKPGNNCIPLGWCLWVKVCVLSCSHCTHLCVPAYLPLGLAVLEITTPLFSFHEEIFAHAGRNMLSRFLKTVSLKYIYMFYFFEGVLMVLRKSSKPVCFGRLLLLAFWI